MEKGNKIKKIEEKSIKNIKLHGIKRHKKAYTCSSKFDRLVLLIYFLVQRGNTEENVVLLLKIHNFGTIKFPILENKFFWYDLK